MFRNFSLRTVAATSIWIAFAPAAAEARGIIHTDPLPPRDAPAARTAQLGGSLTPSQTLPHGWCGEETGTDYPGDFDNGASRYHGVYFVPADAQSRLRELADGFQQDAIHATALIERQHGRAIRFDMGTSCGPEYLDITTVRLPHTTAELEQFAGRNVRLYQAVADALAAALPASISGRADIATNYVGWLDGPAPQHTCGQASLVNDTRRSSANMSDYGGKLALIYRQAGQFCDGDVVRHEIGHTLGAIMAVAPHANGGHASDALEDTMAATGAPSAGGGDVYGEFFDYGGDDYWGDLPWWTVDMSRFICAAPNCNVPPRRAPAIPVQPPVEPQSPPSVEPDSAAPRRFAPTKKLPTRKRRVCRRVRTRSGKTSRRCRVARIRARVRSRR